MTGLVEAFAKAGYSLANPRTDWSAISPDESSVALTVWQDQIVKGSGAMYLDLRSLGNVGDWQSRQGHQKRTRHIAHGLANCGGRFEIILCRAVDQTAEPRKVAHAEHWRRLIGVIKPEEFEPATGLFRIVFVPASE